MYIDTLCEAYYYSLTARISFRPVDRREHPIEIKPHGNSMPFSRCKPSVIKKLKHSAEVKQPTKALQEIENSMGGVMAARSLCDLPRDRKQVYNIISAAKRHSENSVTGTSSTISHSDVLAQVMQKFKETSGSDAYVRAVEAAPEPMCVLTTDQQFWKDTPHFQIVPSTLKVSQ